jgi:hypothetical protein
VPAIPVTIHLAATNTRHAVPPSINLQTPGALNSHPPPPRPAHTHTQLNPPCQHHHVACCLCNHVWVAVPVATHPAAKVKQPVMEGQSGLADVGQSSVNTPAGVQERMHTSTGQGGRGGSEQTRQ